MKFLKLTVPAVLVLCVATMITSVLKATKPTAEKRSRPARLPSVEILQVKPGSYAITIATRGEVQARTRSVLIPEVSGRIDAVNEDFRDGGFFEEGDILLEIDPRDYETAVTVARGNLAEAENALEQEKARAAQAKENWERLGNGKEATALVLRVPQMNEASARVSAAAAQLEQAETDLERTKIRAPYAGRILEQLADVGQYVTTGTELARIFAVDYAEIRLPLTNRQAAFIDLPEDFRGESTSPDSEDLPALTLTKKQGLKEFSWDGKIVRTEGAIDLLSRQVFVIGQVDDPYAKREDGAPPLKIGDFVEAQIEGYTLTDVYTVPRTAVREGNQLLLVDAEQRLRIRDVEIAWGDDENVVVSGGLAPGDIICTTPPAFATEGAQVDPLTDDDGGAPGAPRQSGRHKPRAEE